MNGDFDQKLQSLVEESLGRYTAFLQKLLQIPCPRMGEHRAVHFIAEGLRSHGCEVKVFEGEGSGEPTPEGLPINMFASRKGVGSGKSLILASHLDCVPVGDLSRWKHGPWSADIENGRMYARGAHDDRSGAAIICMVVDLLNRLNIQTQGDLYFMATTEEEFSCGGMRVWARSADRVHADAYLEVDGNPKNSVIIGLGGALSFEIRIEGPFGSTQRPENVHAANPIELMGTLVQRLRDFERDLPCDPGWAPKVVAVTDIRSKGWFSNVPEECTASGFANALPPLSRPELKTRFENFVQQAAKEIPWLSSHPPVISWGPLELDSLLTSEQSEFLQILSDAHRKNFGTSLQTRKAGGWADAQMLGIPHTVLYGPGGGGGDHAYDEYYELDTLAPMLKTLVKVVVDWCGQAGGGVSV